MPDAEKYWQRLLADLPRKPVPPARGWWDMACWNGLSREQQRMLIEDGVLFAGRWEPEGGTCPNGAEVEVTTMWDESPGPRFYCADCAIGYLQERSGTTGP